MCKCGCNTCGTNEGPLLTEGKVKSLLSEGLQYHIDKKIPLFETVYRIGSNKHLSLIKEARKMYSRNIINLCEEDEALIKTHLGEFALYEGESVPLDLPMLEESNMPSQEEVNKFFSDTQQEIHYLNSKPVKDWDEYDMSNWKSKLRKKELGRPQFGESLNETQYEAVADLGDKKTKENLDSFEEVQDFMNKMVKRNAISVDVTKISQEGKSKTITYDWDGGKWLRVSKEEVNEKEGVPHYTKDGKEWKGKLHKMPDGSLMSGDPHDENGSGPNGESEKLYHKEDLVKESLQEKLKGIDGKACWKGYKLAGTKKKGGKTVDNCVPMEEAEFKGKEVPLGKPKRGGPKAYYVYVKDGDKVKKVTFGSGGLRAKIKNKEARNAFAARHNCKDKKDRTTPGYWSCNLPRYAQALGLGANQNTF